MVDAFQKMADQRDKALQKMVDQRAATETKKLDYALQRDMARYPDLRIQRAIRILHAEYPQKLLQDFLSVISLVSDRDKAVVFCEMEPGDMRDAWLSNEIAKAWRG